MEKLQFSITIKAPAEKVWNTMLGDDTYREWTKEFMPGSYFVGDWSQGSKILFVANGENGKMSGMVSRIRSNRPHEFVSIEHIGFITDGVEDTSSEEVKKWAGAHENYTFMSRGNSTEVRVDTDTPGEYREMFLESWPRALEKLRELAEQ